MGVYRDHHNCFAQEARDVLSARFVARPSHLNYTSKTTKTLCHQDSFPFFSLQTGVTCAMLVDGLNGKSHRDNPNPKHSHNPVRLSWRGCGRVVSTSPTSYPCCLLPLNLTLPNHSPKRNPNPELIVASGERFSLVSIECW